jgi:Icc-related predicted phosphoesterase
VKILCLGDLHLSDRPPSSCTDTYLDDLLQLLTHVIEVVVEEQGVSFIVLAGDIFHNKAPSRNSHKLVQLLIRILRKSKVPVFIVPGNHDIQNDRLESIYLTQPLGVILESGAAELLDGWNGFLFGLPWQQRWEDEYVQSALLDYTIAQNSGEKPYNCLVVTHAPLYPPGQELPYEFYPAANFADAMGNHGCVFYGHVHEPHGIYEVNGVRFCNPGAFSRGSLHEYNLTRDIYATIWDSNTGTFDQVRLPAKPADQVFRLQDQDRRVDAKEHLGGFLAEIGSTRLEVVSAEAVTERVKQLGLGKDVELLVEELLAEAVHGGAKS